MGLVKSITPPMGWNSWDCYGTTVTEAEVVANAEFMAEHLLVHGWDTVVVDIDWSDPTAKAHGYNAVAPLVMDEFGRLQPDPVRFPSSAGGAGFAPLAATIHGLGLKFGIHVMRGIPRRAVQADLPIEGSEFTASQVADRLNVCEWNPDMFGLDPQHRGSQAYDDSCLRLYAEWGVDFIKADDMLWPYQAEAIASYHRAIEACGRDIALSLSPGRDLSLSRLEHLREHATMWRICDDLWDRWADVEANFTRFARWAPLAGRQGWPDGDMLPLGRIGIRAERGVPRDDLLTPAERRTLMTLWLVAGSPLMIGGDLPSSDPATLALFTHAEALAVHATGGREIFREEELVIWSADGGQVAAVFNLADEPRTWLLDSQNLGLPGAISSGALVEVWSGEAVAVGEQARAQAGEHEWLIDRGVAPGSTPILLTVAPHGVALVRHRGR